MRQSGGRNHGGGLGRQWGARRRVPARPPRDSLPRKRGGKAQLLQIHRSSSARGRADASRRHCAGESRATTSCGGNRGKRGSVERVRLLPLLSLVLLRHANHSLRARCVSRKSHPNETRATGASCTARCGPLSLGGRPSNRRYAQGGGRAKGRHIPARGSRRDANAHGAPRAAAQDLHRRDFRVPSMALC